MEYRIISRYFKGVKEVFIYYMFSYVVGILYIFVFYISFISIYYFILR